MGGIVTRYQHLTGADYSRVFATQFSQKKVVYITNALALGLLQIYVRTDGTSGLLNESLLNTQLLNSRFLASNNLTLTDNCTVEYDEDAQIYRIEFPSETTGVVIYSAQFADSI